MFDLIELPEPLDLGKGVKLEALQTKWELVLADGRVGAIAYNAVGAGKRTYFVDAIAILEPVGSWAPLPDSDDCAIAIYKVGDVVKGVRIAGAKYLGVRTVSDEGLSIPLEKALGQHERFTELSIGKGAWASAETGLGTLSLSGESGGFKRATLRLKTRAKTLEEADNALSSALKELNLL